MLSKRSTRFGCLMALSVAGLSLAGVTAASPTQEGEPVKTYDCDGSMALAQFSGDEVFLQYRGTQHRLQAEEAASGVKYVVEEVTETPIVFWMNGDVATVQEADQEPVECTEQAQ
ncbi:MliC family protein [Marinimicrobium sp. ARAG 43.8]|uniref:MliC family protein n=1 Tax=Marinimicrobium sp. ARAG 43.8 TaxID=3418719 RepID=UPI003CFA8A80